MDVRCERCRAQYVFDDAQVTEAGLTVQCSNCGHVFKVKKKALVVTVPVKPDEVVAAHPIAAADAAKAEHPAESPPALPDKGREWRVRQANGNVFTFKELTTLQKWIVERKVTRDDEISLSGDQWKRLGNIGELATFFQVVEAAERSQAYALAPAVTPVPTPSYPVTGSYPLPHPPNSAPVFPAQPAYPVATPPAVPPGPAGPATTPHAPISGPPAGGSAAWEVQAAAPPNAAAAEPAWTSQAGPPRVGRDFDDEEQRPRRRGGGAWSAALLLALIAVLVGGAAVYFLKPEWIDWTGVPRLSFGERAVPALARPNPVPPRPTEQPLPAAPAASAPPAPLATPQAPVPGPQATVAAPAPSTQPSAEAPRPGGPKTPPAAAPAAEAKSVTATDAKPAAAAALGPELRDTSKPGAKVEPTRVGSPLQAAEQPDERRGAAPHTEHDKAPRAPRGVKALLAQAKRLRDQGKTERALDLYGEVAEKEPENAEALAGRGWCYLDLSQYSPAEASFQAALDKDPQHPEALMGLAETYRYEGHKAEAVRFYERYLAAHPEGEDSVAARNAISQLKE